MFNKLVTAALIAIIALAFWNAVDVFALENNLPTGHIDSGLRAQPITHTHIEHHTTEAQPTHSVDSAEFIPLYSCTYDAAGNVVSCILIGYGDPNAPEL